MSVTADFLALLQSEWGFLFFQGHRLGYPLEEQYRVLMKRLHQQYSEIIKMPTRIREYLFKQELEELSREKEKTNEIG